MHIPEGFLGPSTWASFWLIMIPIWALASKKLQAGLKTKHVPLLSIGAAFSFVIMMFNVPIPGGSTGHAVGAVLIAIILGPWAAVIAVSTALTIQALLFGDGGITAIAANSFNMAVVIPFTGYYVYRLLSAGSKLESRRRWIAAGIGGYVGVNAGAISTGVMLGLQPLLYHTPTGQALYFPYNLNIAVPAMAFEHLIFIGFIELAVTAMVIRYFQQSDPEMLKITEEVNA
ncbi:fused nickel transport protein NikMN [archaeon BMS3Abin16]|nr:fused nickel transport protein NikMN [archaeon BMS3Abin16]HDY73694.1 cobalt transporter CbiM [Euryarchaeota archaeon]